MIKLLALLSAWAGLSCATLPQNGVTDVCEVIAEPAAYDRRAVALEGDYVFQGPHTEFMSSSLCEGNVYLVIPEDSPVSRRITDLFEANVRDGDRSWVTFPVEMQGTISVHRTAGRTIIGLEVEKVSSQ